MEEVVASVVSAVHGEVDQSGASGLEGALDDAHGQRVADVDHRRAALLQRLETETAEVRKHGVWRQIAAPVRRADVAVQDHQVQAPDVAQVEGEKASHAGRGDAFIGIRWAHGDQVESAGRVVDCDVHASAETTENDVAVAVAIHVRSGDVGDLGGRAEVEIERASREALGLAVEDRHHVGQGGHDDVAPTIVLTAVWRADVLRGDDGGPEGLAEQRAGVSER